MYSFTAVSGLAIMASFLSGTASAQQGGDASTAGEVASPIAPRALDDIIVTARKRSESMMSVPVAVTAISAPVLQRSDASSLTRVAQISPQIQIVDRSSAIASFISIRGIGSASQDPGVDQSTLIDIDGVQINRGSVTSLALFDLQQVEVLKGPQSLFFGKNSPVGVISVKSMGPGDEVSGYLRTGYEFGARERFVEGAVGGAISNSLGVRLALRAAKSDGWIKNVAAVGPYPNPFAAAFPNPGRISKSTPATSDYAGRLTVAWRPSSNFSSTLKLLLADNRNNGDSGVREPYCVGSRTKLTDSGIVDPSSDCRINGVVSYGALNAQLSREIPGGSFDGKSFGKSRNILGSLISSYEFSSLILASTTGYYRYRSSGQDGANLTSNPNLYGRNILTNSSVTQEVRLSSDFKSPLNFVVGAFYENGKRTGDYIANATYAVGPDPLTGIRYNTASKAFDDTSAYSAFFQLKWAVLDNVELTGGARYTKEVKEADRLVLVRHSAFATAFAAPGTLLSNTYKDDNISPEVTFSWKPQVGQLLYAAYKFGYHSGGFGSPSLLTRVQNLGPLGTPGTLRFDSEKVRGGEIGYKASLIDRTLRVELAAFTYKFDNLQTASFQPAVLSYLIGNAGKARTQGLEASMEWLATEEISLRGAVGYADAKYLRYLGAPCTAAQSAVTPSGCVQDLSGRQLPRAPRLVASGGVDYDVELASGLWLGVNGDFKYTSSSLQIDTLDPNSLQKAYWLFNSGIRLYEGDDGWSASLQGRNLTNRRAKRFVTAKSGGTADQYAAWALRDREIRLEIGYRF